MTIFLFGVFLAFALINLAYYLAFFSFASAKSNAVAGNKPPLSVIVCAKNEAENLTNFIPSILEQDYPEFEVVLINDASIDQSLDVMEKFQSLDGRVKIVNVVNNEAFWANKKYALTLGIKKAQHQLLVFTDADCAPQSQNWLSQMAVNFSRDTSIVLGYGGYFKHKNSFINKLVRFETLLTAIQYFSYAKLGHPYMGVGRNLAYTAKVFYDQKGFASHLHIKSGDDDLFVNEAATKTNTAICFEKDAITRSVPKTTFKDWFRQKRRHASIATHYKASDKFLLGLFYSARLLFWMLFLILLIFQINWEFTLATAGILLLVKGVVYYKAAKKLDELDLVWMFPVLEVFLIFSQLWIFFANIFSKPTHWK